MVVERGRQWREGVMMYVCSLFVGGREVCGLYAIPYDT